ncbi:MAG: hypothetical protein COS88_04820 [Chloroflexi bacterium CG07_land_8_20_14_0_80_51_10]|nr:MAG: hypothetical protein COS88_04820 [Chloroflexi bacterium CG07_land_8_20_14_0_80_51_10]
MVRAAKLDIDLYNEVKADEGATPQAFKAVLVASSATGIGYGISIVIEDGFAWLTWGLLLGVVLAVLTWLLWSFTTYVVGTKLFRRPDTAATYRGLLHATGFANSPGTLGILLFVPFLGRLLSLAIFIWTLVAGIIAVRQALDFSTFRAIATCLVGWIVYVLVIIAPVLVLFWIAKLA